MNKNTWFKHHNTSSDGQSLQLLIADQDYETIFFWWWLLERVSLWEDCESDDNRGHCLLSYSIIKRELGWNFQRTSRVLSKIALSFQVNIQPQTEPNTFQVSIPNWLKYQETRGGKREAKKMQSSDRLKTKDIRLKTKEINLDQRKVDRPIFNFDLIYQEYPRKLGKAKGLQACKAQIKTQEDYDLLMRAVKEYGKFCRKNGTEPQFIKQFKTFMADWRDWLDPQNGTVVDMKPKTDWKKVFGDDWKEDDEAL